MLRLNLTQLQHAAWAINDIMWYYSDRTTVDKETFDAAIITLQDLGIEVDL